MGQAFDDRGNVLGAFGATKAEVAAKLKEQFGDLIGTMEIHRVKDNLITTGQAAEGPAKPVQDRMLQFFRYEHLPEHLRAVSAPFGLLALQIAQTIPNNPERTVALRKLLEAKDCAVRAALYEP